jgi:hypothetical protein
MTDRQPGQPAPEASGRLAEPDSTAPAAGAPAGPEYIYAIALDVIGVFLLLPGLCSVFFAPMALFNLSLYTSPQGESVGFDETLRIVWATGLILGALGVWLIIRARRIRRGR